VIACRVLGHRRRFWAEEEVMHWDCERGCGLEGEKRYASAGDAQRYARAFDHRDSDDLGKRPSLSLLPLWLGRRASRAETRRSR
jgi:hypothetical protein